MRGSAVEQVQCYEARTGAASAPLGPGYKRREPETSVLHEVVRENLETCLAQAREERPESFSSEFKLGAA